MAITKGTSAALIALATMLTQAVAAPTLQARQGFDFKVVCEEYRPQDFEYGIAVVTSTTATFDGQGFGNDQTSPNIVVYDSTCTKIAAGDFEPQGTGNGFAFEFTIAPDLTYRATNQYVGASSISETALVYRVGEGENVGLGPRFCQETRNSAAAISVSSFRACNFPKVL